MGSLWPVIRRSIIYLITNINYLLWNEADLKDIFVHGSTALHEIPRFLSNTQHSLGLLWTSDRSVTEISTWQHTSPERDRRPCPRRIRTRNPSKREVVERLNHWNRRTKWYRTTRVCVVPYVEWGNILYESEILQYNSIINWYLTVKIGNSSNSNCEKIFATPAFNFKRTLRAC